MSLTSYYKYHKNQAYVKILTDNMTIPTVSRNIILRIP
jgi:hypothetical protein